MRRRRSTFGNDDDPLDREFDIDYYRHTVQGELETAREQHLHEVREQLAHGIFGLRHEVRAQIPQAFDVKDTYSYFLERERPSFGMSQSAAVAMIEGYHSKIYRQLVAKEEGAFRARKFFPDHHDVSIQSVIDAHDAQLKKQSNPRNGYVDFPDRNTAEVVLPSNAGEALPNDRVAETVFYEQFLCETWNWRYGAPRLFAAIESHVAENEDPAKDPFEWVLQRAKYAAGYSLVGGGKDCSPQFLTEAYTRVARRVWEQKPDDYSVERRYEISEDDRRVLDELFGFYANDVRPEAAMFVLEIAQMIDPQDVRKQPLKGFLMKLPELLDKGLNIDRVLQLIRKQADDECTPEERIAMACAMAEGIHRGEAPWWHHNNIDLCGGFDKPNGPSALGETTVPDTKEGRYVMTLLAQNAKHAFPYAVEAYKKAGHALANLKPFGTEDAVLLTAYVTQRYGIGNPQRAVNVLRLNIRFLVDTPLHERTRRIQELKRTIDEQKPASAIVGRLEGEDATMYLPEASNLVYTALGHEEAERRGVHPLNVSMDDIRATQVPLGLPLGQRARIQPALVDEVRHMEKQGLLTGQSAEGRLALPVPEEHEVATEKEPDAALGLLDFYRQLRDECGYLNEKVTQYYFTFCALRMRDPMHPPKGFLKFLQVFEDIPDKNYRHTFMEHPDDRDEVSEENMKHGVNKSMIIANVLDAWVMGLIDEDDMRSIMGWMTEKSSETYRKNVEARLLAQRDERMKNIRQSRQYEIDEGFETEQLTDEEVARIADENIAQETEHNCQNHERTLQETRLEALKRVFGFLSVVNSLANVRYFSREELSDVLRKSLPALKKTKQPDPEEATLLPLEGEDFRTALAAARELADYDLVQFDEMRAAVEECESEADARDVLREFMEHMYLDHLKHSRDRITAAVHTITDEMKRMNDEEDIDVFGMEMRLNQLIQTKREELETELTQLWSGSPFIVSDVVERVLNREFRVARYTELFGPMHRFNTQVLPEALPPAPENAMVADITTTNRHTAQVFNFVGMRYIQEQTKDGESQDLASFNERHGEASKVNVTEGAQTVRTAVEDSLYSGNRRELFSQLADYLPQYQEQVDEWRLQNVPLGSIGGRWHFDNPIYDENLQMFNAVMQLGQTPFRMIHANTSLIIPGFNSRQEMKAFIMMLALEGLIDPSRPELQVGVPGRLKPDLAAYFGSSNILGTAECAPFELESFIADSDWNSWATAARIVAYDAYRESGGERRNYELPFMVAGEPDSGVNVPGRTDILGRWHVNLSTSSELPNFETMDDIDIPHYVGAALRHVQYGGPLKEAGKSYMERHRTILERYDLSSVLHAPWIFTREIDAYDKKFVLDPTHFDRAIKPCMDAHFEHSDDFANGEGVVFEVRQNIDLLIKEADSIRQQILQDPRWADQVQSLLQRKSHVIITTES